MVSKIGFLIILLTTHAVVFASPPPANWAEIRNNSNLLLRCLDGVLVPLELELVRINDTQGISSIFDLSKLERLAVQDFRIAEAELLKKLLGKCPKLNSLALSSRSAVPVGYVDGELLKTLCTKNSQASIKDLSLQQIDLSTLSAVGTLKSRDFSRMHSLTVSGALGKSLPELLRLGDFECIRINSTSQESYLSAENLSLLIRLPNLRRLSVSAGPASPSLCVNISKLQPLGKLESLRLVNCKLDGTSMKGFSELQSLHLEVCRLTTEVFDAIMTHPTLDCVTLAACHTGNLSINKERIGRHARNKTLDLQFPTIAALTKFDALEADLSVTLGNLAAPFSGPSRERSLECRGHRNILHKNSLSSLDFASVANLKNLRELRIQACAIEADEFPAISPVRALALDAVEIEKSSFLEALLTSSINRNTAELTVLCTSCPTSEKGPILVDGTGLQKLSLNDLSIKQIHFLKDSLSSVKHVSLENLEYPSDISALCGTGLGNQVVDLEIGFSTFNDGELNSALNAFPNVKSLLLYYCHFKSVEDLKVIGKCKSLKSVHFVMSDATIDSKAIGASCGESCQEVGFLNIPPLRN